MIILYDIQHPYRALQMLAAIESRLEELFETIESLPPEKVEAAEKVCSCRNGPGENYCSLHATSAKI